MPRRPALITLLAFFTVSALTMPAGAGLGFAGSGDGAGLRAEAPTAGTPGVEFVKRVDLELLEFPNDVAFDDEACPGPTPQGDCTEYFYSLHNGTSSVVKYALIDEKSTGNTHSLHDVTFGGDRLYVPLALAYGNGVLYVTSFNNEVVMFDPNGTFIGKFGESGSGNGQFDYPASIAVDPLGFVYVTDTRNERVQKFTSDGDYVSQFGTSGTGDGQFVVPLGIAIDQDGSIYVSDEYLHRIQKFSSTGTFIMEWGTQGPESGQLSYPDELAVDRDGNIWVAESGGPRVQRFGPNGEPLGYFTGTGAKDSMFSSPHGIDADSQGRILVASSADSRLYLFRMVEPKVVIELRYRDVGKIIRKAHVLYEGEYNQSFASCEGSATGRMTLGAPVNESFSIGRKDISLPRGSKKIDIKINLEPREAKMVRDVRNGQKIEINVTFKFTCTDNEKHTVRTSDTLFQ